MVNDRFCAAVVADLRELYDPALRWPPVGEVEMAALLAAFERKRRSAAAGGLLRARPLWPLALRAFSLFGENYGEAVRDGIPGLVELQFHQVRAYLLRRWSERATGPQHDGLAVFDGPDIDSLRQQPCTPATAAARARLMAKELGDGRGPVLFAGDDDLVGLRLAALTRREVCVIDIDARLLELIEREARSRGLSVRTRRVDLMEGLPQELRGRFAAVAVDPPYGASGTRRFLAPALDGLREGRGARLFLSVSTPMLGPALGSVEAGLRERGLARADLREDFNEYPVPADCAARMRLTRFFFRRPRDVLYVETPSFFSDLLIYAR